MDFVYAPPPPPPSSSTTRNNGKHNKSINQRYNSNNSTTSNRMISGSFKKDTSPNAFLDLPTHLPNDVPKEVPTPVSHTEQKPQVEETEFEEPADIDESKPIYIAGTSISLQTEEDIAKWIEERKKKWPSRKNIEIKEQQKQQQLLQKQDQKRPLEGGSSQDKQKKSKTICKFFQQHKHCKFGNKCKNLHESTPINSHSKTHYTRTINSIPVLIPKLYSNRQNSALFKNLVQRDQYEHENSTVLDFIQYLDKKGLIKHDVTKK